MRLARAALPDQHYWFGSSDVAAFGQLAHLRRRDLPRSCEFEPFQRFHAWQLGIVQPMSNGVPVPLFTLHRQQCFQVTHVAAIFFHRLFGQRHKIRADYGHLHCLAILPHRCVFQSLRLLIHGRTAPSNWS
jgi:hypothetical protein